jgi:hypothetical protein
MTYEIDVTLGEHLLFKVTCLETLSMTLKVKESLKDKFGTCTLQLYQVDETRVKIVN